MLGDQFQRSIPKAHERTKSSFSTVLRSNTSAIRIKKSTGAWRVLPATIFSKRKGAYPTRLANSETLVLRLATILDSVSWNSFIASPFDLTYALTSNPRITVFSVPFGATLSGAYTAQIIEVLDNRHKFVEPLPVAYVHAQPERNLRFTDMCGWAAMGQIVDRFQEFAALLSYLSKLCTHLYPPNSLRRKPLE